MCSQPVLTHNEVVALLADVFPSGKDFAISPGSAKGDGYASFLTKVDFGESHLIIKCAPRNEHVRAIMSFDEAFKREALFYSGVIKALAFHDDVPRFYKATLTPPNECIVMDNILRLGYKMWDRKLIYMDEQHLKLALQSYAKLHGRSFALKHCAEAFSNLKSKLYYVMKDVPDSNAFYGVLKTAIKDTAELFKDSNRILYEKLVLFHDSAVEYFKFATETAGDNVVVTHGDCWCNNMMFEYKVCNSTKL